MDTLIIEAGQTERQYWRDLWRYRELFYFLAWRDILVRYKQTVVGVAWSVIRPFLTMVVLTIVFLVVLMLWYRFVPPANIAWIPFFIVLAFAASFGAGLWIAALMVEYRDFKFIVPFIVQFGLYVSPVGFLSTV